LSSFDALVHLLSKICISAKDCHLTRALGSALLELGSACGFEFEFSFGGGARESLINCMNMQIVESERELKCVLFKLRCALI
jgi:hypothetical protein